MRLSMGTLVYKFYAHAPQESELSLQLLAAAARCSCSLQLLAAAARCSCSLQLLAAAACKRDR
jgi:hypothetical protein